MTGTPSRGLSMCPEPPNNTVAACEERCPETQSDRRCVPFRTQTWVSCRFYPLRLDLRNSQRSFDCKASAVDPVSFWWSVKILDWKHRCGWLKAQSALCPCSSHPLTCEINPYSPQDIRSHYGIGLRFLVRGPSIHARLLHHSSISEIFKDSRSRSRGL